MPDLTSALQRRGFQAETTPSGVQHRWRRGEAVIDVLIPRHLGPVAANRKGAGGGPTIETPGAQKAVNRTELIDVKIGDRGGTVPRPSLLGALIAKGAAYTVVLDANRDRHLGDFALLATLLRPSDVDDHPPLDKRELELVSNALGNARANPRAWSHVNNGAEAIERLTGVVATIRRDRQVSGAGPSEPAAAPPARPVWRAASRKA